MTSLVLAAVGGTVFGEILFSEEWIRMGNTFLNFLTIALLVYRERHIRKDLQPKVEKVVEKVEHVEEIVERRRLDLPSGNNERRED